MFTEKEKIKHLPINLFFGLGTFGMALSACTLIQDNFNISLLIAFVVYINNVITESRADYLEEQINKLKNK